MQAKLELSDEDDKGEKFDVMVEPLQQRYNAAAQPRVGASNIPNGWSKQLILRIYTSPALKGNKMSWIRQWNEMYPDYHLSKQKLRYRINNQ